MDPFGDVLDNGSDQFASPSSSNPPPPPTIDPRIRSTTPPDPRPAKRGRIGSSHGSPRKAAGRSRTAPLNYQLGSSSQLPSTSGRNKGKSKAQDGLPDLPDDVLSDGIEATLPTTFNQRIQEFKAKHSGDGWYEIMRILERRIHHIVMESFFLAWGPAFYNMLVDQAVKAYRRKHQGVEDPMEGPFYFIFFHFFLRHLLIILRLVFLSLFRSGGRTEGHHEKPRNSLP